MATRQCNSICGVERPGCAADDVDGLVSGDLVYPECEVVEERSEADGLTVSALQCGRCLALLAVRHDGDWGEARFDPYWSIGSCAESASE